MAPVGDGGEEKVLILPLATQVIFPSMRQTIEISKQTFDEVCDYLEKTGSNGIGAVALQPGKRGGLGTELYQVGTFCRLVTNTANGGQDGKEKASPGQVQVSVEGGQRFEILDFVETSPHRVALVRFIEEQEVDNGSVELRALIGSVQEKLTEIVKQAQDGNRQNSWGKRQLKWPSSATMLADVVGATLPQLTVEERQKILETLDVQQRLELVLDLLQRETAAQRMSSEISSNMQRSRELEVRRAFLQRQIQEVQRGLQKLREKADSQDGLDEAEGEEDEKDEVTRLAERLAKVGLTADSQRIVKRELKRLKNIPAHHPEYTTTHTYLETMASLPWKYGTKDRFNIAHARAVMDADHRGLDKVKKRILEFLAVQKMRGNMKGPILCLHGPPGIGKTSLGKSIARAMGRKFHRVALGGVRDEAELRGHRRTYIGSMPGVIIQAFQQLGVNNPVILLDEVDKMSQNQMFNPQATLLEILDPEQNDTFKDHYLNTQFDLSKVLFIATANDTSLIDRPLLDRMEVIDLSGYTVEEKVAIAGSHLLPKQRRLHALEPELPEHETAAEAGETQPPTAEGSEDVVAAVALLEPRLTFTPEATVSLITKWTAESGVRSLERRFAQICRWATLRLQGLDGMSEEGGEQKDAEREAALASAGPDSHGRLTIDAHHLPHIIGVELFEPDIAERLSVGVAMGLSVSAVGGGMLFIEATRNVGRGNLIITGQLGSVMTESVKTAMSLLRSRFVRANDGAAGAGEVLDLLHSSRSTGSRAAADRADAGDADDRDPFKGEDIHVHFPAGGIPKDGPSAGVAVLLALASLLLNRPMRSDTAVTGEVTLRGHVLPVGGIRDKVLAAHRAGVKHVLLPLANKRHVLEDVPAKMRQKVEVHYLKHVNEAIDWAFGRPEDVKKSEMALFQDPVELPPGVPAAAAAALCDRTGTFCIPPSAKL